MDSNTKNTDTFHAVSRHAQQTSEQATCIQVQNLSKVYRLYNNSLDRLKESLLPSAKKYHRDFYALRNVSCEVKAGESIGIIGRNGSGKSTLLKIITGILTPSGGTVSVTGKVSALLELGAGFDPELTGIENIYFNGTITGNTKNDIDARIDAILSFADIGEYVYQPVKTYSSGMFLRLAFAAAINVNPDILIIDEALSVGDVFFQQKCFTAIREVIANGTTCLFVSHDAAVVMNTCTRSILLENGEIDFDGPPEEAVGRYYSKIGSRSPSAAVVPDKGTDGHFEEHSSTSADDILNHDILKSGNYRRDGKQALEILAARIMDRNDFDTMQGEMLHPLYFHLLLKAHEDIQTPTAAIQMYDRFGTLVFAAGTQQLSYTLPSLTMGERLIVKFELTLSMQAGEYTFELIAGEPSPEGPNIGFIHDKYFMLGPIKVTFDYGHKTAPFYGIAQLPMKVYGEKVRN